MNLVADYSSSDDDGASGQESEVQSTRQGLSAPPPQPSHAVAGREESIGSVHGNPGYERQNGQGEDAGMSLVGLSSLPPPSSSVGREDEDVAAGASGKKTEKKKKKEKRKKRKKMLFLPPEIAAALEKGGISSSDDEDTAKSVKMKKRKQHQDGHEADSVSSTSELVNMLPTPARSLSASSSQGSRITLPKKSEIAARNNDEDKGPSRVEGPGEEPVNAGAGKQNSGVHATPGFAVGHGQEANTATYDHSNMQAGYGAYSHTAYPVQASPDFQHAQWHAQQTLHSANDYQDQQGWPQQYAPYGNTYVASGEDQYHYQQAYHDSNFVASGSNSTSVSYGAHDEMQTGHKRGRRRDRDLERQLQQGDLSGIEVREVSAADTRSWTPDLTGIAQQQQKQEIKVAAKFWNAREGQTHTSVKPSRLQRRKHQINQLAHDAKAREIELLERRGAAIKTKSETQAKYGW